MRRLDELAADRRSEVIATVQLLEKSLAAIMKIALFEDLDAELLSDLQARQREFNHLAEALNVHIDNACIFFIGTELDETLQSRRVRQTFGWEDD